jgi:F420-non-reducing hydrogenase small subunit
MYWCASCGGCEESILDMAEDLLILRQKAQIVFWPIAMDAKYDDVKALPDNDLAVTLINGAIRNEEQVEMVRLLRRKSRTIMAHGSCAHLGGVIGLANFYASSTLLDRAYKEVSTLKRAGNLPAQWSRINGVPLELPPLRRSITPLNKVIPVNYYLPGCPPPPQLVKEALFAALSNNLPDVGTVWGDTKALCHTCPRLSSKPEKLKLTGFKRLHQTSWHADICFLAQGLICMGPVARGGCSARCIGANMPCRGCFGPLDHEADQGLQALSMAAALFEDTPSGELQEWIHTIPDAAGLFYLYSLAASILAGRLERNQ